MPPTNRLFVVLLFCLFVCLFREVLLTHFESVEEGTRNVVAECVGKLTLVDPNTLLAKLQVITFTFNIKNLSAFFFMLFLGRRI